MLKKAAIALAILVLLGIGVGAWMWHQATALPDWYTQAPAADDDAGAEPGSGEAPPQWVALDEQGNRMAGVDPIPLVDKIDDEIGNQIDEEIGNQPRVESASKAAPARRKAQPRSKRHEIRNFHRGSAKGAQAPDKALKASRAVLDDGNLELGVILDLSSFPKDKLSAKDRSRYERAVANFPGLTQRDVWVGVEDRPVTVDGFLQLGPDAQVRVGKLQYSLSGAAKRLGMPAAELRAELNRELRRLGLVDPDA